MAANKYISLNTGGQLQQVAGTQTSSGVSNANQIPALDSTGHLDPSLLPPGVVPDVISLISSENFSAGALVNIWNNSGVSTARNADNSNARAAIGFVLVSSSSGATVSVYLPGTPNTALSGLTPGALYFLGTVGAVTVTPPTTATDIVQQVGYAGSASELIFTPQQTVTLA